VLKRIVISVVLLVAMAHSIWAETPDMKEQFVYGLRLFNGRGYTSSFCPETEEVLYILAGSENVLRPAMTIVYYWPITRKLQAGFKTLNESVEGTLEILKDGTVFGKLKRRAYTFHFSKGWYADTSEIVLDKKAVDIYNTYTEAVSLHYERTRAYYEAQVEYRRQMEAFFAELKKRQEAGTVPERSDDRPAPRVPEKPVPPKPPGYFVQKPEKEYIVKLPVGRYDIRMITADGTIVEGSEKTIVSFSHRRSGKVGYEIISEKRWTMPETSSDPAGTIYFKGKNTLYFKPFIQTEYNDLYYSKLLDPQNDGYSDLWRWVNIRQVEQGSIQFVGNARVNATIREKPYYVRQVPGAELGYTIVDFSKETFPDRKPTFVGYKVELEPDREEHGIRLVDNAGVLVPGSFRELRAVDAERVPALYVLSVLLPLAAGIPVFWWRRRMGR